MKGISCFQSPLNTVPSVFCPHHCSEISSPISPGTWTWPQTMSCCQLAYLSVELATVNQSLPLACDLLDSWHVPAHHSPLFHLLSQSILITSLNWCILLLRHFTCLPCLLSSHLIIICLLQSSSQMKHLCFQLNMSERNSTFNFTLLVKLVLPLLNDNLFLPGTWTKILVLSWKEKIPRELVKKQNHVVA